MPMSDLLQGHFAGPTEFAQLVRDALACAASEGWSQMVWSDANFEDWPLREKVVADSLQAWSRSGRKLVILAKNYDSVLRHHARFVTWRNTWGHIVECRVCKTVDASEFPSAIWSPTWVMRRLDVVHSTGVAGFDVQRRVLLKEKLDECQRQSAPGFPTSTLGL
jgi:hypothetical protein